MGAVTFSLDPRLVTSLLSKLPLNVLIETGTFKGDTVAHLECYFNKVYSIELSESLWSDAVMRFEKYPKVQILQGNSPNKLQELRLELTNAGVLYWLDAHWCLASSTSGEFSQCPLLQELEAIGQLNNESVVLIDDARLFLAPPLAPHEISLWPTFQQVLTTLWAMSAEHELMVVNDVIAFFPKSAKPAMELFAQTYGIDWLAATHQTRDYENLHAQFINLNTQLVEKDTEIHRLATELNQYQLEGRPAQTFFPGALAVSVPTIPLYDESVLTQLAETKVSIQRLMADLSAAHTAQIEKEEVIRALANAVRAYRLGYMAIKPLSILLNPLNLVARHGRAMLRPRLGNLNQYPAQALTQTKLRLGAAQLNKTPKISIVTPSFRQGVFIEKTLRSVFDQQYPNLEYFVQDGGSKDSTVAVLEKHADKLSGWVSETDSGQSQAINRGFAKTSGEIMGWLNSDDLLLPGALTMVADYFNRHPEVDVLYGNRLLIDENDMEIGRWLMPGHDSAALSWVDYVPQETLFWRRRIWDKVGGQIDESFRFAMDWDLLVRFRDAGARFAHIPRFMGAFRIHEHQKTSANINDIGHQEMDRIRGRLLGRVPSHKEIRNAAMPYLLKHVAVDLAYRMKIRLRV